MTPTTLYRLFASKDDLVAAYVERADGLYKEWLTGLGLILGAWVLSEFGDDPTRFPDAASRRALRGSCPDQSRLGTQPGGVDAPGL